MRRWLSPVCENIAKRGMAVGTTMRNLASPSFFRAFDIVMNASNPGAKRSCWTFDGVECERERHSFTGPRHGVTLEIHTLTRTGKRGWRLMVVKEYWWGGQESKVLKMTHWAKPLTGQRADILAWLRARETNI
jgi:hypothetical protein